MRELRLRWETMMADAVAGMYAKHDLARLRLESAEGLVDHHLCLKVSWI